MHRPSLRSRLSSRQSTPAPPSILEQEELRLPLELLLHIFDTAVSLCDTEASRDRLCSSLRLVNRTLSQRFPRLKHHVLALPGGEALPELLKRVKDDPSLVDGLEGLSLRNMVPFASRKRLQQDWPKLHKVCGNLAFVQLGDVEVRPKAWDGVPGYVLSAMRGISSLRLVQLEVSHSPPPRTLFSRPATPPLFPPDLRHLCLSSVHLRDIPSISVLPPAQHFQLTILSLTDLTIAGLTPDNLQTLSFIRTLITTTAPSLRALHYTHRRDIANAIPEPSLLNDISFPSLRILSVALADFPTSIFSAAPQLVHLSLTLGDLLRAHRPVPRAMASLHAYQAIEAALLADPQQGEEAAADGNDSTAEPAAAARALQVLEVPLRFAGFMEQELNLFQRAKQKREELVELARAKGVEVRLVNFGNDEPEERFRRTVREVLKERV